MARERMAKLLKYRHFEDRTGHIIISFMIIKNCSIMTKYWIIVISAPRLQMKIWSSQWDPRHFKIYRKKYLVKIECADLENEAKTTRNCPHLSFNFVVATSCPVTPYYSSSLSKYKLYESNVSFNCFGATSCQLSPYHSLSLSRISLTT